MEDTSSPPLCRFEELARRENAIRRRESEVEGLAQDEPSRVFRRLLSVRRSCDERYEEQVLA